MSRKGMKRDRLDDLFSRYIRIRDRWRCQRCGADYRAPERRPFLNCMHLVEGRGKPLTRFDAENCAAGCYGCHRYLDTHPAFKEMWFKSHYGEAQWGRVKLRAMRLGKPDRVLILLWLKTVLRDVEGQEHVRGARGSS